MDELIERLSDIILKRSDTEGCQHPLVRSRLAGDCLMLALDLVRDLCGPTVIQEVYGPAPSSEADILKTAARRLGAASYLFLGCDRDAASFEAMASEANAVSEGDLPHIFAPPQVKRLTQHRVRLAKFEAARWDAYLDGFGVPTATRHSAISSAFGGQWDTISRWKSDAERWWGRLDVAAQLGIERSDGARGLSRLMMLREERWETALIRSGQRYLSEQHAHDASKIRTSRN